MGERFFDEKEQKQNRKHRKSNHIKPSQIKGKIEVRDTRERKDGPGGN